MSGDAQEALAYNFEGMAVDSSPEINRSSRPNDDEALEELPFGGELATDIGTDGNNEVPDDIRNGEIADKVMDDALDGGNADEVLEDAPEEGNADETWEEALEEGLATPEETENKQVEEPWYVRMSPKKAMNHCTDHAIAVTAIRGNLSNLSTTNLMLHGRKWDSVEKYYQWRKCVRAIETLHAAGEHDKERKMYELSETILNYTSAATIKKKVSTAEEEGAFPDLETSWFENGYAHAAMFQGVFARFTQDPEGMKLLTTKYKTAYLIEYSDTDKYWAASKADHTGRNLLGRIMMEVRDYRLSHEDGLASEFKF
jgi:ribA/ribD-fused uncharacterized protein